MGTDGRLRDRGDESVEQRLVEGGQAQRFVYYRVVRWAGGVQR